ncbi:MAG: hypothetical protein D6718_13615 [Acidobacteria bacterium]|nr:MAG: hypothetical protein D6718_13615 [Acidobacteriota bacterium]
MTGESIETAEHVLPGHPDKLCDAAVDAIVERVRRRDPGGQCGLEAACILDTFHVTGRIATRREVLADLDVAEIVRETYRRAGYGIDPAGRAWGPLPEKLQISTGLVQGEFEPGERELRHLSDDQSISVGYANDLEETNHLPPAVWVARRLGRALHLLRNEKGAGEIGPDGKVLARVSRSGSNWRLLSLSISLNHHEKTDWIRMRRLVDEAVERAGIRFRTPDIMLNGAGMFVCGGPNGDNGLSGKKLVADAYGAGVPIGGGAWSGKDLRKVDRLGGLLARWLAKRAVFRGLGREVLVTLTYVPGGDRPATVDARADGRPIDEERFSAALGDPDLSNAAVWQIFRSCEIPLDDLARWGHQQPGVPWETVP